MRAFTFQSKEAKEAFVLEIVGLHITVTSDERYKHNTVILHDMPLALEDTIFLIYCKYEYPRFHSLFHSMGAK